MLNLFELKNEDFSKRAYSKQGQLGQKINFIYFTTIVIKDIKTHQREERS